MQSQCNSDKDRSLELCPTPLSEKEDFEVRPETVIH